MLPWDQLAYWACTIGVNIAASPTQLTDALGITGVVDIGGLMKHLLLGSDQIGNEALVRFYVLHCVLLPLMLVVFMGIHIWRIRKSRGLSHPDRIEPEWQSGLPENKMVPTIPHVFAKEFSVFMFVLAISVALAFFFDAPLRELANPLVPENPAKAPWYFLGVQELVSYSAFTGGIAIPFATLLGLSMIPYFDKENEGFGKWFGNRKGVWITVSSAVYAMICCISILTLTIGFDWPGLWLGGIRQSVIHFINPGTLLVLMFVVWSFFVLHRYQSTRMGAIAFFTCFFIAVVVLTYFAWGHRGPNWDFYWWPLSW